MFVADNRDHIGDNNDAFYKQPAEEYIRRDYRDDPTFENDDALFYYRGEGQKTLTTTVTDVSQQVEGADPMCVGTLNRISLYARPL